MKETAKLLVSCPDRHGLVAESPTLCFVTEATFSTLTSIPTFTTVFSWPGPSGNWTDFRFRANESASAFEASLLECGMHFELIFSDQVPKIAILVSKLPHCLQDLLLRHQIGEFRAEIALVISNHREAEGVASAFGIPFKHAPITAEQASTEEADEIQMIKDAGVELVVLARYMQVLRGICGGVSKPNHQYSSLLPAGLHWGTALSPGFRAWREVDRGNRPLREFRTGQRTSSKRK